MKDFALGASTAMRRTYTRPRAAGVKICRTA
jgi:hypothetical protein